jgi:hypothetical protein
LSSRHDVGLFEEYLSSISGHIPNYR